MFHPIPLKPSRDRHCSITIRSMGDLLQKWRYVSTFFSGHRNFGDISWNLGLKNRPKIYGRYLQSIGSWNGHWFNRHSTLLKSHELTIIFRYEKPFTVASRMKRKLGRGSVLRGWPCIDSWRRKRWMRSMAQWPGWTCSCCLGLKMG